MSDLSKNASASSSDAIMASKSRKGYYQTGKPDTQSNAESDDVARIVLSKNFGVDSSKRSALSPKSAPTRPPMEGLAGRYTDRVVIVTGGSKGIGEGCVRVFFAAGANVVFCSRGREAGEKLASELNSTSRTTTNRAVFQRADVSVIKDLKALVDVTIKEFGRIDCLINNAGWHPPPKQIDDFSITEMQDLFQLNFISYFAACKYALPHLRRVKGNIINMSSLVGVFGQAEAPTYAATKGAITSFSKALAIDEAKNGVRVNVVSPGNIWTPLWKAWSDGEADPDAAKEAGDRVQVMARKGTIIESGRLCLCIAADMTFTTGVDHIQSGGAELGYGIKA